MKVILPKSYIGPAEYSGSPLFFLAGPVRGGGDWQQEMCRLLDGLLNDFYVVIPCRYAEHHPLREHEVRGGQNVFERQLAWEQHYLDKASKSGGVLFWLGCQKEERTDPEPYAMDTRGEIGEWRARKHYEPHLKLFVGGEEGFHGLSQIERNFANMLGNSFPIYKSMSDLAYAAATHKAES